MRFTKMEGLGNDYVYLDRFALPGLSDDEGELGELARRMADRHFGIGGDGLIVVGPGKHAPFRMQMFNSDGSLSEMCGNGLRCVAKLVADAGYDGATGDRFEVESGAGTYAVEVASRHQDGTVATVRIGMGTPGLRNREVPTTGAPDEQTRHMPLPLDASKPDGERAWITCVSIGNPHAVLFVDDVDAAPVHTWGPQLETHAYFPRRTNVEFVEVVSPTHLKQRTWERGAGETLACGSGACAALVAAHLVGRAQRTAAIDLLGGRLSVTWDEATNQLAKTGPAVTVFEGDWRG